MTDAVGTITATLTCMLPVPLAWSIDTGPATPLKDAPASRLDADAPDRTRPTNYDDTTRASSVGVAATLACTLPAPETWLTTTRPTVFAAASPSVTADADALWTHAAPAGTALDTATVKCYVRDLTATRHAGTTPVRR